MEKLLGLYQARLETLTETINSLHKIVGNDEAIKLMEGPHLLRYRIDRVNELVKDILSSEKQQIIINLIAKCQQLQTKANQQNSNSHIDHMKAKDREYEQSLTKKQIEQIKEQIAFERHTSYSVKLQLQQRIEALQKELTQKQQIQLDLRNQLKSRGQLKLDEISVQTKMDIETISKKLEIERKQLNMQRLELAKEKELIAKRKEKEQECSGKEETIRVKLERINNLKKQMGRVSYELERNKQMMHLLKNGINSMIKQQIKELRQCCSQLKEYIIQALKQIATELRGNQIPQDTVLNRMAKLEKAMNAFIEEQGLKDQ